MSQLPTGTVTLLFTDIEGSTHLLQQLGKRYADMLSTCRQLLRSAFLHWNGVEVETQGDAFFLTFARANDAVSAAVDMQRALSSYALPNEVKVRIRIGLHTGEPQLSSGGYVGHEVQHAARIMNAGHGGQVLLSQTTRELVKYDLPEGVSLLELGEHRLKDLQHPIHLYQLNIAGLPTDFPPLKTLDNHPHNLPVPPTPLIGRERQVAAILSLFSREEVRLVTLTGAGGTGKTRIALRVAAELSNAFPDGVYFVNLAPISDHELVISTIAHVLDVKDVGEQPLLDLLRAFLREKHLLLLLDNFEQVVDAAVQVADLLASCPKLKMIVTSRMALHIQAEHEFAVPPLAVPDPKRLSDLEALSQYEAVALFIQRAQAVKSDFSVSNANAPAVAEVCVRLDGLPLAIELAAARIKVLPPQALLARLGQRLAVLTSGARDVPARQQTLSNTIEWSYQLLDAQEQRLFRRLSIFVNGCALDAVDAVCAALDSDPAARHVLDGIASLIDKNLLQPTEQDGNEPRLVMLETIREYGLECLNKGGEATLIQIAHARYFLSMAEELEPQYFGAQATAVLDQLEREFENLRAALKFMAEVEERELALRLAGALWWFWYARGHLSEGRHWYEQLLNNSEGVAATVRAQALVHFGWIAYHLGDSAHASPPLRAGLSLYRQLGNQKKTGIALYRLGLVARDERDFVAAQSLIEEALQLFYDVADKEGIADSVLELSHIYIEKGEYIHAQNLAEQSVMLFREIGDQYGIVYALLDLARVVLLLGDALTSHSLTKESLAISVRLGHPHGIAACLVQLAEISVAIGETERAAQLWGTEEALRDKAHVMGYTFSRNFEKMFGERSVKVVRSHLGEQVFAAAWAEGRAMTPEQVLAALESVAIPLASSSSREFSKVLMKPPPLFPNGLTAREVEVLRLVAQGLTDAQVAERLVISPRTVNTHLTSIYNKLGVDSRTAASRFAIEQRLV